MNIRWYLLFGNRQIILFTNAFILTKHIIALSFRYPNLKLVKSLFLFRLGAILFHFIPAFFLDLVTKLSGGRPMYVKLFLLLFYNFKYYILYNFFLQSDTLA